MIHICPTDVVHAQPDAIWHLLITPRELAAWTDTRLVDASERELRAGDRVVLASGFERRLRIVLHVLEAVPPQHLALDIRLPFGVGNDKMIRIMPASRETARVTFE